MTNTTIKTTDEMTQESVLFYVGYTMESTLTGEKVEVEEKFDSYSEAESFLNKEKRKEIYGWVTSDFIIDVY